MEFILPTNGLNLFSLPSFDTLNIADTSNVVANNNNLPDLSKFQLPSSFPSIDKVEVIPELSTINFETIPVIPVIPVINSKEKIEIVPIINSEVIPTINSGEKIEVVPIINSEVIPVIDTEEKIEIVPIVPIINSEVISTINPGEKIEVVPISEFNTTVPIVENKKEKLSILCIGDPHYKEHNTIEMQEFNVKILNFVTQNKPDLVVILGDVLHDHKDINVYPLELATRMILSLSDIIPVYVLIGNHDRPNNSDFMSNYHPFPGLEFKHNVTLVPRTKETTFKGHRLIFVPYVFPGRFEEALFMYLSHSKMLHLILHTKNFVMQKWEPLHLK
jgi:hypothetical protein